MDPVFSGVPGAGVASGRAMEAVLGYRFGGVF